MHVVYSASTNRQTGDTADLNGNIGSGYLYDIENRLLRPGASSTVQYGYDAGNKRVWCGDTGVDEFAFFAGNQKLATYTLAVSGTSVRHQLTETNVYFDAGVNFWASKMPWYAMASAISGVELHPFQALLEKDPIGIFGGADPFGRAGTIANGFSSLPDFSNAAIVAERANDLVGRDGLVEKTLEVQSQLFAEAELATQFAKHAALLAKSVKTFVGISYLYQAYECLNKK
ncbi:MAG: hypothetical protein ABL967_18890 [Bryobacteraceae bacterium]